MSGGPALATRGVPLATRLDAFGDRVALVADGGELSYRELAGRVERRREALGPVRRLVLLAASNDVESVVTYLAALAGGHPVVLAPGDHPEAVDAIADGYRPDVVSWPARLGPEPVEHRPGTATALHPDLALLLSTSGSTGSSKLVRLSSENVQSNAEAIAAYLGLGPDDRAVTSLPISYCYGLSVLNSHLVVGGSVVLTDLSVVDRCFWDLVREARVSTLAGVPFTFDLLDRVGVDRLSLPSLRTVTQAGGRLAPERVRRYAALGERQGWRFFVMYGQTEATARMAYLPPELATRRPEAIGVPIPGGSFRIEPVDGCAAGEGELVYRGPNVMLGYAHGPADLAEGPTVAELRTGDLARRGDDGLYEIVGRRSRFVKVFGLRVDLGQVERLLEAEGVTAACVGVEEELAVAVEAPADVASVRALVAGRIGLPPRRVRVVEVEALPRLANGKPDYPAVERLAAAAPVAPGTAAGEPPADVRGLFAAALGCGPVGDEDTFVDLGGDSLSYVEVSVALEALLGHLPSDWHVTPVGVLERAKTVGQGRRGWGSAVGVETNVVLRAVAIALVVGTHAGMFWIRGGAHVLLAVAGFNLARFQLARADRSPVTAVLAGAARVAVPSMCWIALLLLVTDDYSVANLLLVHGQTGPEGWDQRWRYWYVEALVQLLIVVAGILSFGPARRFERAHGFACAAAALAVTLVARFAFLAWDDTPRYVHLPQTVAWLFALGWAAQRADTPRRKALLTVVVALTVPGFFGDPVRQAVVVAGLLLLLWVRTLVVPAALTRLVTAVAAASLYVYLTHWQVYPAVRAVASPAVAVAASLVVGVAASAVAQPLVARGERRLRGWCAQSRTGRATVGRPADAATRPSPS